MGLRYLSSGSPTVYPTKSSVSPGNVEMSNRGVSPGDPEPIYRKVSRSVSPGSSPKDVYVEIKDPNPNPFNFRIKKLTQHLVYTLVLVNYPDATTYEGNKILLFKGDNQDPMEFGDSLDPHFLGTKESPIARFVPTDEGWSMGLKMMYSLTQSGYKD